MTLTRNDDDVYFWNVDYKVGLGAATRGLEVKLVQFLLIDWSNHSPGQWDTGKVDGVWGKKSAAVLSDFQRQNSASVDGVVTPFPPGKITGAKHGVTYNILLLQMGYVGNFRDIHDPGQLSADDINAVTLGMHLDEYNGIPSDLRARMKTVCDRFVANLARRNAYV